MAHAPRMSSFDAGKWVAVQAKELVRKLPDEPASTSTTESLINASIDDLQPPDGESPELVSTPPSAVEDTANSENQSKSDATETPADEPGTTKPSQPSPPADAPPKIRLERRQELEHHLKASPTDLDAFLELGRIYQADNRPIDAKRVLQQAIQVFPEETELLWEYEEAVLARSFQQLREVTELANRLETVETDRELKRCQDDWACRRMDVCRARLARDPSKKQLRVALSEAMYDAGMYEGTLEELEPILEDDELSSAAHLIRGRALLALQREVEAMTSFRAASLRRAVVSPIKTRVLALRLLCETAERLGLTLTLTRYKESLQQAETELAAMNAASSRRHPAPNQ